ncbi:MAG: hypothetical protein PUE51_05740 [Veillonellaceae bacterium]|nr:hypothetical protein [Veillonellaceae bacterium]
MGTSCTIKKIKVIESMGKIEIDCTNTTDKGEDDLKGLFAEAAAPDFYRAMDDLRGSVAGILEAPELAARLKPFAVTFHYGKDGRMGAIISAKLALPMAGTETVVNTPMRKCPIDEKPGGAFFDETTVTRLWKVEAEARAYLMGKRAEGNLFDGEAAGEQEAADGDLAASAANVLPFAKEA